MLSHLPSPILSVAADVVKELEGEDAVFALWTLFTKCKESLKDGRRLENISWRLWYREIAASQHTPSSSPGSSSPPFSERRSASPITPISEDGQTLNPHVSQALLSPTVDLTTAHSWHGQTPTPFANGRRLSTATVPAQFKPNTSVSVGRIILEILPDKLDVHKSKRRHAVAHDKPQAAVQPPAIPQIAQPRPMVALPTMQLPSPPRQETGCPRVVVVNPTPHPTPPATPHIAPPAAAQPASQRFTHLLPPAPTRALVTTSTAVHPAGPISPEQSLSRDPARDDETLKPSDRRFFLQEAESPERDSPEHTSCLAATNASKTDAPSQGLSPSSAASSHALSDAASTGAISKRPASRQQGRKNKEVARHVQARPALHRTHTHARLQHQMIQRKAPAHEAKKTTAFNIGSASSNGSHGAAAGPLKAPAVLKDPVVTRARQSSPPKVANAVVQPPRRGVVVSTSSEYETTDTDDDSWASEDNSADDDKARKERQREETRLREAAEEAQRQRDMFAKVPKRSYSNLNRTRSGLLSQLLNPDPTIFPPNHPYRTSFSTQDMTQYARHGTFAPTLPTSKSSAAVPLAAQVTAQAPSTNGAQQSGAYVRKGRPQGAEMEDSDSGDENPDNAIQVSHSLAQQKLAALAGPSRRRQLDRPAPPQQPACPPVQPARPPVHPARPPIQTVATAPIALGHPYNLPAPAAPMTPRTTRRQMLSTELSESLRRNLLWERQVSKVNMTGGARRGGLLGSGLRPLTAANGESSRTSDKTSSRSGNESEDKDERERERKRRAGVSRNRSWANDYHYAGW